MRTNVLQLNGKTSCLSCPATQQRIDCGGPERHCQSVTPVHLKSVPPPPSPTLTFITTPMQCSQLETLEWTERGETQKAWHQVPFPAPPPTPHMYKVCRRVVWRYWGQERERDGLVMECEAGIAIRMGTWVWWGVGGAWIFVASDSIGVTITNRY